MAYPEMEKAPHPLRWLERLAAATPPARTPVSGHRNPRGRPMNILRLVSGFVFHYPLFMAKIQVGEYSTIIGLIKRTQRIIGKVFTISGVVAAFRKRAILDVGMWSDDMVTENC